LNYLTIRPDRGITLRVGNRGRDIDFMTERNIQSLKVLVVDDHPPMRKIITEILRELGVRDFAEADDGRSALAVMEKFEPDIVFIDNKMMPMDGVEFTRRVRAGIEGVDQGLPIIMVSAYTEKERIVEARDAGITEFLAKPLSSKMVVMRLHSVLENPRPMVRSQKFFGPDRRRRRGGAEGAERRRRHHSDDAHAWRRDQ
jgi:two-component system, chemotaxis family, chemotaxis protein CheY